MAEGGTIRLTMVAPCIECDAIPPPNGLSTAHKR
jgi:hypothetical protein